MRCREPFNYFRGNDPEQWRTGVATYRKVRYQEAYPGIDLVFYGNQGQLEYDFVISPGADPGAIRLTFDGHDDLRLDDRGNLVLAIAGTDLVQHAPRVYQELGASRQAVAGRYVVGDGGEVGFELGDFDPARPLVIDPVLQYSTCLGGFSTDVGHDVSVDRAGNRYVVGETQSPDFPTADAAQPALSFGSSDGFVAKLDPSGTRLVYATYLGGSSPDRAYGIAVDDDGNAYVSGYTASTGDWHGPVDVLPADFPISNALQPAGSGIDGFLTKFNLAGTELVYSTYLGGTSTDYLTGVAVDGLGSAYVVGTTVSEDFPVTPGAFDVTPPGQAAVVAKINAAGSALE